MLGTNNAIIDNSVQITVKLIKLKDHILSVIPNCKIIFSQLINRYDNAKAQLTIVRINESISNMGLYIDNSNITREHLGKKGLHMNPHGTGKLAINFINILKKL